MKMRGVWGKKGFLTGNTFLDILLMILLLLVLSAAVYYGIQRATS